MKGLFKKFLCLVLCSIMVIGVCAPLVACSKKDPNTFTWFIPKDDGQGSYYSTYNDSLPVQWLNNQTWDAENHKMATNGEGSKVQLDFKTPIAGSEADYLGTMFGSGEYDDIIDLTYSTSSTQQLIEDGVLMEITEYVENYMPNYTAFLNEHPDARELATVKDESGKRHYYALYQVSDKPNENFMGYVYRRDWVVAYADVPSHVWDRENILKDANDASSVDTSKITYTDYYEAQSHNDWKGWKVQTEVTAFTYSDGANGTPDKDYTDNVIFPSGTNEPLYISDWEWMFRAFNKALAAEGLSSDPDAYATTIYYEGALGTGDLFSSFGSGNPFWYHTNETDGSKKGAFGGDSETMKTYLTAMNNWYKNGWLDKKFNERTDIFYKINETSFGAGKVGMTQAGLAYVGDTIRRTQHAGKKTDAMIFGCKLPINDVYGTDEHKFLIPDSMYGEAPASSPVGISTAAKDKDLPALFTMLDWLYSEEGWLFARFGLNEEQHNSMTFKGDYYNEYGITSAYEKKADGKYYFVEKSATDTPLKNALSGQRFSCAVRYNSKEGNSYDKIISNAVNDCWGYYTDKTDVVRYTTFMTDAQSISYNNKLSQLRTYTDQELPKLIKNGLGNNDSSWNTFTSILKKYDYESVNKIYDDIFKSL